MTDAEIKECARWLQEIEHHKREIELLKQQSAGHEKEIRSLQAAVESVRGAYGKRPMCQACGNDHVGMC